MMNGIWGCCFICIPIGLTAITCVLTLFFKPEEYLAHHWAGSGDFQFQTVKSLDWFTEQNLRRKPWLLPSSSWWVPEIPDNSRMFRSNSRTVFAMSSSFDVALFGDRGNRLTDWTTSTFYIMITNLERQERLWSSRSRCWLKLSPNSKLVKPLHERSNFAGFSGRPLFRGSCWTSFRISNWANGLANLLLQDTGWSSKQKSNSTVVGRVTRSRRWLNSNKRQALETAWQGNSFKTLVKIKANSETFQIAWLGHTLETLVEHPTKCQTLQTAWQGNSFHSLVEHFTKFQALQTVRQCHPLKPPIEHPTKGQIL